MAAFRSYDLAPKGSVGNINGTAVTGCDDARTVALEFQVEAVGATPTITYKLQGALNRDPGQLLDSQPASDVWDDLALRVSNPATAAVTTDTKTATGTFIYFVDGIDIRRWRKFRLVTSANTNVTFSARLHVRSE